MPRKISAAQAAASRRNGAKSRGPKTAAGRARAARNATKHGLCARRMMLLVDENPRRSAPSRPRCTRSLRPRAPCRPTGRARRVAAWRARRADRLEAAVLGRHLEGASLFARGVQSALGLGLSAERGGRTLDTLVRYRGSALAELFRSLAALKALQAERSLPALLDAKTEQTRESAANQ